MFKNLKKSWLKKKRRFQRDFKRYKKYLKKHSKNLRRHRLGLIFGMGLILLGFSLGGLTVFNVWLSQRSSAATSSQALKSNSDTNKVPLISGVPIRVELPSVGIDLKVIPGYYYPASKSWTLSLNDAQWGVMTAKPNNQGGDTFIYAHYRLHVFYTLPKIKVGDQAIVTTDNKHVFSYTFHSSTITSPNDASLFAYKGKPILVLQTCTGVWFENRQLFIFDLAKVV